MSATVLFSIIVMGGLALVLAVLLFFVARFFFVKEDPRKTDVEGLLPGINCGACGFPGCPGMAEALVAAADKGDISALYCPPGGSAVMNSVAGYFGLSAGEHEATTAVLRCNGSSCNSPAKVRYDGPASCLIANNLYSGSGGCAFGCLGEGDCVRACTFDAMVMNKETGLPEIDEKKCTSCGACVKACPRNLIQIRPLGVENKRVWINCRNTEKGALAKKNCSVACIGCGKCVKVCDSIAKAITMENNLAYIDPKLCIACGKCVPACPTNAISASFVVEGVKS